MAPSSRSRKVLYHGLQMRVARISSYKATQKKRRPDSESASNFESRCTVKHLKLDCFFCPLRCSMWLFSVDGRIPSDYRHFRPDGAGTREIQTRRTRVWNRVSRSFTKASQDLPPLGNDYSHCKESAGNSGRPCFGDFRNPDFPVHASEILTPTLQPGTPVPCPDALQHA